MLFLIHEDRVEGEVGLRVLLASLRRHCPGNPVWVFHPRPSEEFRRWLARIPQAELKPAPAGQLHGWNCKPALLLRGLEAGHDAVVWLDSDILVQRDPRALLAGHGPDALVLAREPMNQPSQGTVCRARAWGLPEGRELGFTVNTCVVRVAQGHVSLLRAWDALLHQPEYLAQQALPYAQRRPEMLGDQDALGALLGAADGESVAIGVLESGVELIHSGGMLMYGVRERLRGLPRCAPYFIHALADKPWVAPVVAEGWFAMLVAVTREISPYVANVRGYRHELELDSSAWLDRRTVAGRLLTVLGLGHDALRGLPLTIVLRIGRRCFPRVRRSVEAVPGVAGFPPHGRFPGLLGEPAVLSVIVPVYNGAEHLAAQFAQLAQQDFGEPWELIYVDNGSTDGSQTLIGGFRPSRFMRLRLVEAAACRGQAYARNVGADVATTDFLLFTDQDDLPAPNWVRELFGALAGNAAAGGFVRVTRAGLAPVLDFGGKPAPRLPTILGAFDLAYGTNFAIRRNVLQALQGWRVLTPGIWAGEDTDLCIRLKLQGITLGYAPEARVIWRSKQTIPSIWRQGLAYGRSDVLAFVQFRAQGAEPRGWRAAATTWAYAVGRFPRILFGPTGRAGEAVHKLAWAVGRTWQSLLSRALYI